jgi:protein-S-isoprenylcysteine O-methyltransferase Ste14
MIARSARAAPDETSMSDTPDDRPNRLPLPPIIYIGCLLGGWLLAEYAPVPVDLPRELLRIKGAVMIGLGLMLMVWSSSTLSRARTTVLPHRPSTALVTTGPFSVSRNPIYIGNTLVLAGFGGIAGSLWYWVAAGVALVLVDRLAVRREEAHLAARFPAGWVTYSARVRRWL